MTNPAGLCAGRVAIVTGAARGIGREHALELARLGARVVVNDYEGPRQDSGGSGPAQGVVDEILSAGGEAIANGDDVSDWAGAKHLIDEAIATFGGLDVVVNNAGILRDRMLVSLTESEWDDVIRVHLKGTAATSHWAAAYWRERSKAGAAVDARIINTTSSSGLYGNPGQTNYGAAKAGIAGFTIIAAMELGRYGVTVNAIAPSARTRMTETLVGGRSSAPVVPGQFDYAAAANVAPLVAWLASRESAGVTGRVFNIQGGAISVAEAWHVGPSVDKGARWEAAELSAIIPGLVASAQPNPDKFGNV
jgi:NAD(P)-dependent dehydrogenase (short-subunit alcohol dehydrogenase family)